MFVTLELIKSVLFFVILMVFHREILPDLMNNFYIYPGPITRRVKGVRYTRVPACQGALSRQKRGKKYIFVASTTLHVKYSGARLIEYVYWIHYYKLFDFISE